MHSRNRNLVTPSWTGILDTQISTPLAPFSSFSLPSTNHVMKNMTCAISGVGKFFSALHRHSFFPPENQDWSPWYPLAAFAHESYARLAPSAFTVKRSGGWERWSTDSALEKKQWLIYSTPWSLTKHLKSYNSTRKIVFQPSFFRAYVSFQVSISCWTRVQPAVLVCWSVPGKTGVCLPLLPEGSSRSATS